MDNLRSRLWTGRFLSYFDPVCLSAIYFRETPRGDRASMYLLGPSEPYMDLGVSSFRGASQSPSEAPVRGLSVTPCGRWVLDVSDPLLSRVRDIAVLLEKRANIQSLAAPERPMDGPVEGELEGAAIKRPVRGPVSLASIPQISLSIDRGNTNRAACLVDMVNGFSCLQPVANLGASTARNVGLGQAGPIDSVPAGVASDPPGEGG